MVKRNIMIRATELLHDAYKESNNFIILDISILILGQIT
jgi:hypothetical protein